MSSGGSTAATTGSTISFCFIPTAIAKSTAPELRGRSGCFIAPLQGLEPDEGKLSHPVLRGRGWPQGRLATRLTERIIEKLESGTVPWHKPWRSIGAPRNLVSNKLYRG